LADVHHDLMNLGEWWRGIEDEVFWLWDKAGLLTYKEK
jgi:hypothetical protein